MITLWKYEPLIWAILGAIGAYVNVLNGEVRLASVMAACSVYLLLDLIP